MPKNKHQCQYKKALKETDIEVAKLIVRMSLIVLILGVYCAYLMLSK